MSIYSYLSISIFLTVYIYLSKCLSVYLSLCLSKGLFVWLARLQLAKAVETASYLFTYLHNRLSA